jgi:hypothetical protein
MDYRSNVQAPYGSGGPVLSAQLRTLEQHGIIACTEPLEAGLEAAIAAANLLDPKVHSFGADDIDARLHDTYAGLLHLFKHGYLKTHRDGEGRQRYFITPEGLERMRDALTDIELRFSIKKGTEEAVGTLRL